jgi:hypothetical protein
MLGYHQLARVLALVLEWGLPLAMEWESELALVLEWACLLAVLA